MYLGEVGGLDPPLAPLRSAPGLKATCAVENQRMILHNIYAVEVLLPQRQKNWPPYVQTWKWTV